MSNSALTTEEMVKILVDKGYSETYAKIVAPQDWEYLNNQRINGPGNDEWRQECSVCRRTFTYIQMLYHYHPCE